MNEKIIIVFWFDDEDYRQRLLIKWSLWTLSFLDWESEDNNLSRNFSDCLKIKNLIEKANNLWLEWNKIEIVEIQDDNIFSDNYEI